jgi:ATP-binding cassette, subfamily B, bacterial PglK
MLVASFAEVLSIGAVLPFLGVLTAPERIFNLPVVQPVIQVFNFTEPSQLLLPLTVLFGIASLFSGAMRLLLLWGSTKLSYATGADLSINIYRLTLFQPYSVHCARNSSEIINAISNKTNAVIYILTTLLTLVSSVAMLITILLTLLSVDPFMTFTAFGIFGLIYIATIFMNRKQLSINSDRIAQESTNVIKSLQEGLGGIRDVLINGSQATYCHIYRNADLPLRHAQGSSTFIGGSPRFFMEALGMVLIAALAYALAQQPEGIVKGIPMLGALALGAQRLLPILQQSYAAWAGIRGNKTSLQDALELLDQQLPDYANLPPPKPITFNHNISLKQVDFRYSSETPYVLQRINLKIEKGSRVGFIGKSGSGKSTLLDIVMGLLQNHDGKLEIDGLEIKPSNERAWQSHIAHVPQSIFLADCTIEENIAFGIPKKEINTQLVRHAAQQSQIADSIESFSGQYQTIVGERGIRLSGGQRQRIGIARALYKQADVIIFDEATSSLDTETEQAVMQAIEGLSKDLTLLIVAHRLTTLKNCTQIVELDEGRIKSFGTYKDIVKKYVVASNKKKDKQRVDN